MGGVAGKIFSKRTARVLMVGLDAAGKTSILYQLKLGEIVTTIPTLGFNVENVVHEGIDFHIWDVGTRERTRSLWKHYMQNTDAIIFVVDSNDRDRLEEASDALDRHVLVDTLPLSVCCIIANKQELPGAMTTHEILEKFNIPLLNSRVRWNCFACSATTGNGLREALSWMVSAIRENEGNAEGKLIGCDCPDLLAPRHRSVHRGLRRVKDDGGETVAAASTAPAQGQGAGVSEVPGDAATSASAAAAAPSAAAPAAPAPATTAAAAGAVPNTVAYQPESLPVAAEMPHRDTDSIATATMTDVELAAHVGSGGSNDIADVRATLSHEDMIRFIHHHLSRIERGTSGRKVAVDAILAGMRAYQEAHNQIFHLTYIYFWIQLTDLALHRPVATPDPAANVTAEEGKGASLEFKKLIARNPYLMNDLLVLQYYTRQLIFHTSKTMEEFTLPDIKPLPSVLNFNINLTQ